MLHIPEGATHTNPGGGPYFYKHDGGCNWWFWSYFKLRWEISGYEPTWDVLIPIRLKHSHHIKTLGEKISEAF